jgi:hypothetical protein
LMRSGNLLMSSEPAAGNTLINTVNANHSVGTHYARHERRASKVQCLGEARPWAPKIGSRGSVRTLFIGHHS